MLRVVCWLMLAVVVEGNSLFAQPRLSIEFKTNDFLRLKTSAHASSAVVLESTTNFTSWQPAAHTLESFFNFPVAPAKERSFYRLRVQPVTATNDWKNELLFVEDPLRSPDDQEIRWVKFLILRNDPSRVYFQDSSKFPFHYNFASQRMGQFQGMSQAAFDGVTLRRTNQEAVLGTILFPRDQTFVEYGIQFVGLDAYTPQEVGEWFNLVRASVYATNGVRAIYVPTFEQSEVARTNAATFAALGISVASIERWVPINHVYSAGWALGTLKYIPAAEIANAFADGRLRPQDILLTDGVPAETPLVAGIISLTPSTPNSHTAILSQSFGIPFVYLPDSGDQQRAQALVGRKVMLRAKGGFLWSEVRLVDVEAAVSPALETEILALKKAGPIQYTPKAVFGAISASTENLTPNDIKYFGGKAANYGMLRDYVPTNSPVAIAYSFDLWDAFMGQLVGGVTLRDTITARLAKYTNYPPDIPALKADLDWVRNLIRQTAVFTDSQKQAITNALTIFDPTRKIRFRSSTNVEDADNFTGAGLYDSYSGCLLDDLDGDTAGPSICDPSEQNERGVFRAIQRVYASFYNDNAFLERLRHGVKESEVGMAVLVHHSFPDEEELANGVATLRASFSSFSTNFWGTMVTQLGANSVSNPDGSSIPEVVEVSRYGTSSFFTLSRRSSLVPLGAYVMNWESEYRGMLDLLAAVSLGFHKTYPPREEFFLDFEYKKDLNLGLVVKQVRQIPQPSDSGTTTAFLINEPTTYCVAQREQGDVFANHRLKSIWNFDTISARLTSANLAQGLYGAVALEFRSNAIPLNISGPLNAFPNAGRTADGRTNSWTTGVGVDQWKWVLATEINPQVPSAEPPLLTQRDFLKTVSVTYPRPVPTLDYEGTVITTTNDFVYLEPCPQLGPGAIRREYAFTNKGGVKIETIFYWPKPPTGIVAGYTAPLVTFVQTKISGLTTQPITLQNYYSQTYHPFHHNFSEEFIFEPRLDPTVPASALQELNAANIRLIYVRRGESVLFKAMSPAGTIRDL